VHPTISWYCWWHWQFRLSNVCRGRPGWCFISRIEA